MIIVQRLTGAFALALASQAIAEPGITRLEYDPVSNLIMVDRAFVNDDGSVVSILTTSISGPGGLVFQESDSWNAVGLPNIEPEDMSGDGMLIVDKDGVWDVQSELLVDLGLDNHLGISDDGNVVAGYIVSLSGFPEATASVGGQIVEIGPGVFSSANAVNADGSVVYYLQISEPTSVQKWSDGSSNRVDGIGGATIRKCNSTGDVLLLSAEVSPQYLRPYLFIDDVQYMLADDLERFSGQNEALSMTESGDLVIGFSHQNVWLNPSDDVPLVWTGADTLLTLTEFVEAEGIDLTGWILNRATDITPDGKYIVGGGQYNGVNSGFIIERDIDNVCQADLTGDGSLDFFDVSAFLSAFSANDPVADFTDDGSFDFFDVSAFLAAFGKGCP